MSGETHIKADILLDVGADNRCRLFNNPVGEGWAGKTVRHEGANVLIANARRIRYGLSVGSPDAVGWRTVIITPEMVGKPVAVFLGIEVKTPTGTSSLEQLAFARVLRAAGGLSGVARSVHEARKIALLDRKT